MSAAEHVIAFIETPVGGGRSAVGRVPLGPAPLGQACTVSFESVSFSYAGRPILSGTTFSIAAGERVALTGASGAGKSTILNILLCFISPEGGRVRVDGGELAGIDRQAWLDRVAWLAQKPTLFHGSIRENIRLGRLSAGDAEIRDAARFACVDEFTGRLPDGLDTVVGEGGKGLSAGQIQRVALARLFLRRPSLVLLDEPTAHLDAESAELVSAGIDALTRGHTVVLVTHHGTRSADRTLLLDAGEVREGG